MRGIKHQKKSNQSKRKLTEADSKDIIEYRAVLADMNFYTINKCKDILKSYNLEFMYVTFDKYGGYPYIEFRGSKQDIIKFLTSDFCGESEDDLRKRKPELFESKQRIDGKRKLTEDTKEETVEHMNYILDTVNDWIDTSEDELDSVFSDKDNTLQVSNSDESDTYKLRVDFIPVYTVSSEAYGDFYRYTTSKPVAHKDDNEVIKAIIRMINRLRKI